MAIIEIKQENNKVWRVTKLINPDLDFNYFGIDIVDEAVYFEDYEDVKDRVLVVRVNKSTEELYLDYMDPKSEVINIYYSKDSEVTNPTNKRALKQAIKYYFDTFYSDNMEYIVEE